MMACACAATVANIYYNQPLLENFARFFRITASQAGLVATASQIGYGIGLLLFIPLGDLIERRTVILALAYTCSGLLVTTALSNSFWMLVGAQFFVGVSSVSAQLLIPLAVDLSPPAQRGRMIGALMAGVLCGILLARTISGFVAQYLGWQAMYWAAAVIMLATGAMLQAMLPRRPPALAMSYRRLMWSLWGLWRSQPKLRNASFVGAASFAAFCAFWGVLSFLLHDRFHRGAADAGLFGLVGLAGAFCAPLAGKISDRKGPIFTLTVAMMLSIAAFMQMWVWTSIAGLIVGVVVLDLGVQAVQVAAQFEVMALLPEARNRLNTIYMVSRFVGGALGTTAGTIAYAHAGWAGASLFCIVVLAAGTASHMIFHRRRHLVAPG
jgi:predicted MFS family arabinose efflux permease